MGLFGEIGVWMGIEYLGNITYLVGIKVLYYGMFDYYFLFWSFVIPNLSC